jgi:thymidylate synthase ThyX
MFKRYYSRIVHSEPFIIGFIDNNIKNMSRFFHMKNKYPVNEFLWFKLIINCPKYFAVDITQYRNTSKDIISFNEFSGRYSFIEDKKIMSRIDKITYDNLIYLGVAKELARIFLPLNTQTIIMIQLNLRSFKELIDFFSKSKKEDNKLFAAICQSELDIMNNYSTK